MEKTLRIAMFVAGFMAIAMCVNSVTQAKFLHLRSSVSDSDNIITVKERERQLDCLAKNVYYEAGNESFEGKVAVAQVTMNRSQSGHFPKDVCAVVYQKNSFMGAVICQFSWYCKNAGHGPVMNKENYNESYEVAKKVLLEDFRLDGLKEALYYHADFIDPQWNKSRIKKIGHHIFYKE